MTSLLRQASAAVLGRRSAGEAARPAAAWATDALQFFDASIYALAHQLSVSWHTAWDAMNAEAPGRMAGGNALGVDAHVWSRTCPPGSGMVTGIVDRTRAAHGMVHARLIRDELPEAHHRPGRVPRREAWLRHGR